MNKLYSNHNQTIEKYNSKMSLKLQTYPDGLMFSMRFGMRFSALYIIAPGPTVIVLLQNISLAIV